MPCNHFSPRLESGISSNSSKTLIWQSLSHREGLSLSPSSRSGFEVSCLTGRPRVRHRLRTAYYKKRPEQKHVVHAQVDSKRATSGPRWPASPTLFLTALGGLAAISADLFAPWGARWIFQTVDQPTHAWVVSHIPKFFRDLVFEIGVSNFSIVLACTGWALCTGILLSDATDDLRDGMPSEGVPPESNLGEEILRLKLRGRQRLAEAWILYVTAGGFIIPGDNVLVRIMKRLGHRTRPSTRHKSFSFPSGHTVAVTFLVGTLLFVLLPCILDLAEARAKTNSVSQQGILKNESLRNLARSAVQNGGRLWGLAVVSTAAGRILGDVHWVTDTAAGGCLGAALVSGFLLFSREPSRPTQS